jgi:hypothetical protein
VSKGSTTRLVGDLVNQYASLELADPSYQRDYCWDLKRAKAFLDRTIELGHVLGIVTVYRILEGTTWFIQDGKQRLTTLRKATENRAQYGLSEDDLSRLKSCQVSQQAMEYKSHDEARRDFQLLNQGVQLIPYEKYRGDLEIDKNGQELYEYIRNSVETLSLVATGKSCTQTNNRKRQGQLHRNALALFFQFASGHEELSLYSKSEKKPDVQIERRTRAWLEKNLSQAKKQQELFVKNIEAVNAVLSYCANRSAPNTHKQFEDNAVRAFYALRTYMRNIGAPASKFEDFVQWYCNHCKKLKNWPSRFVVSEAGDEIRFDNTNLLWVEKCVQYGAPSVSKIERTKRLVTRAGYEESHLVPHSVAGDEFPVIGEPSLVNRSRGARAVSVTEIRKAIQENE